MELLIFVLIIAVVFGLLIWGVGMLNFLPMIFRQIIMAFLAFIGALAIAKRAGLF